MEHFEALTLALEGWFGHPLIELPDALRERVAQEFSPMPWEQLTEVQRRSVALQLDYQNDPATEQGRQHWWDFFNRVDALKQQVAEWKAVATPTAAELATKENRLKELRRELAQMDAQNRLVREDYFPQRESAAIRQSPGPAVRYVAYPKAMQQLTARLGATPEELAAWIFYGPKLGGITAYVNANELDSPPRFSYSYFVGTSDYIAPLMACWFKVEDIDQFVPADRYIVGAALIERWSKRPGLQAMAFIQAKIEESRLSDMHPTYGGTRGTFSEQADWPPLESGLFPWAHVLQIEAEDFDATIETGSLAQADVVTSIVPQEQTAVGSPEWRKKNARAAANALHDKPGGSRDKQSKIREIWASGKYSSRNICAEEECAGLNMSYDTARKALMNTLDPSRC